MLGKLLKHEFRATRRTMLAILLGSLAASAVGFGLVILCLHPSLLPAVEGEVLGVLRTIAYVPLTLIIIASYIFGFASSMIVLIFILMRYYKNFFSDEGYLTFTLPVTPHELLWSKIISAMVWIFGAFVTTCLAFVSLFGSLYLVAAASEGIDVNMMISSLAESLRQVFGELSTVYFGSAEAWFAILRTTLTSVLLGIVQLIIYYFAITLGAMVSKKHKVWASIGMYIAINAGISTFKGILSFITAGIMGIISKGDVSAFSVAVVGYVQDAAMLIVGIIVYFITVRILKKKVNLE